MQRDMNGPLAPGELKANPLNVLPRQLLPASAPAGCASLSFDDAAADRRLDRSRVGVQASEFEQLLDVRRGESFAR